MAKGYRPDHRGSIFNFFWPVTSYLATHVFSFLVGAVLFFVAFEAFFMGLLAMAAEFLLGALAWWTIMVGNLLAAFAMGWYLWEHHPRLREALKEDPLDRTD